MLSYNRFFLAEAEELQKEMDEYRWDSLNSLNEADGELTVGQAWKKVRQGASDYFSASPQKQKQYAKEGDEIRRGVKLATGGKSNPKLSKAGPDLQPTGASTPKLGKSAGKKYRVAGLTLAPSTKSGIDVCPGASSECRAACLDTAGRGVMKTTKDARVRRTRFMFDHPAHFFAHLDRAITTEKAAAAKKGETLAFRPNVLSDIPFEKLAPQLMKKHPDVQFFDYTKLPGRHESPSKPPNLHITYSSTGIEGPEQNWPQVKNHLDKGGVAAMVFDARTPTSKRAADELPTHVTDHATGKKYKVIDGDKHDLRFLDKQEHGIPEHEGVIAGLRLKGVSDKLERAGDFAVHPDEHGNVVARNPSKSGIIKLKDLHEVSGA